MDTKTMKYSTNNIKIYEKIYEKYMIILKRYLCVVLKSGRTFLGGSAYT